MILFYLKVAFRNIFRNKQNSLIMIVSLVIAFTFTNLLLSFIVHETNTDTFHQKKDRIYRLFSSDPMGGEERIRVIMNSTREYISQHYPEIEQICSVTALDVNGVVLATNQQAFNDMMVLSVTPSFFRIFGYPLLEGSPAGALTRKDGIVLSEATAQKLFGRPPYVNRSIELRKDTTRHLLQVTAVVSNRAGPTQFRFDALVPDIDYETIQYPGTAFVLMKPGTNVENLIAKVNRNKDVPSLLGAGNATYSAEPFTATYFNQESVLPFERSRSNQFIWICWGVVFLISFAVGFNFVNLFITGMTARGKELGVRKVLGASKSEIGFSICVEIGLYVAISFLLSMAVAVEFLPYFNAAFNTSLTLSYLTRVEVTGLIAFLVILVGTLLSIYLVYYLRRLDLTSLLQDDLGRRIKINRFLFTAQFVVAAGLIICSTIVIRQMMFIKNKPLGFNRHLLEIPAPNEDLKQRMSVFKDKLLRYPELSANVALASGNPISGNWQARYEIDDKTVFSPYLIWGDKDLPEVLHLQIIDGVSYRKGENSGKLVNEELVRVLGIKDPVGKAIPGTDAKIAGIVRDFNSVSLKQKISPYIISYNEHPSSLLVDISETDLSYILPLIKESWEEVYTGYIFDYKLIDDELLAKHEEDIRFFRILIGFTLASVLISCFGLYGVASFTTVQRTKEIGIRKVLGASIISILKLLSLDYFKWIGLGFFIAAPIAWYTMNQWLTDFAYRIEIGPGTLITAGGVGVLIALATVSWQSIQAALANPVDSLRSE